jgi:hypothetical protein
MQSSGCLNNYKSKNEIANYEKVKKVIVFINFELDSTILRRFYLYSLQLSLNYFDSNFTKRIQICIKLFGDLFGSHNFKALLNKFKDFLSRHLEYSTDTLKGKKSAFSLSMFL